MSPSDKARATTPLKRYQDLVITAILLAVPFFVLRTNMKRPDAQTALDRLVLKVMTPVQHAAAVMARGVCDVWDGYVYLVSVKAENEQLTYDNGRLRETVHRLEEKQVENQQLRRLLQLKENTPGETVSAAVVGKDFNRFFRVTRVVLDRSSREIRPHMPVISPDGVVGAVLHVTGDALDLQLAVDTAFGIDVEDERTQARGLVRGTGDATRYSCRVEMVDSRDEVQEGDLLVTSGKGKWFPHGIPVGRVTRVVRREMGRDQEVEAVPSVNFSRLDNVLVLLTGVGDESPSPTDSQPKGKGR